ncbi:uncharacterized protein ACLA_043630 [Aspergillus clavatus NRRL 1]|uniref:GPI anchored protein n=1 Tax=Aspergillus clavatus (strain ATCC 1007 / CBS 513.65 / DSM 816 / NCTC 3887 / NRRL 1 / QM 1276 / 107) TaxID=344612 RepID=A1C8K6_ASPCL|nr:uncharacterized protein ACLA_043630 [Aspergillus clavatus NRRL 1]EAW13643.1 conserved hypothetical protein [Aspergillus clavatus NRRL 1]
MRHFHLALLALASTAVLAQDPGPSPTASVGCEPHGDHWHCDGPASPTATSTTTKPSLAPSPTESSGCEPHGDHWHCDGPASTAAVTATTTHSPDDEHDEHVTGSPSPTAPSPTASVGCTPHGDHWHCDGPRETGSGTGSVSAGSTLVASTSSATSSAAGTVQTGNGGASMGVDLSIAAGLAVAVAAFHI